MYKNHQSVDSIQSVFSTKTLNTLKFIPLWNTTHLEHIVDVVSSINAIVMLISKGKKKPTLLQPFRLPVRILFFYNKNYQLYSKRCVTKFHFSTYYIKKKRYFL